jgi:hypothetical protein
MREANPRYREQKLREQRRKELELKTARRRAIAAESAPPPTPPSLKNDPSKKSIAAHASRATKESKHLRLSSKKQHGSDDEEDEDMDSPASEDMDEENDNDHDSNPSEDKGDKETEGHARNRRAGRRRRAFGLKGKRSHTSSGDGSVGSGDDGVGLDIETFLDAPHSIDRVSTRSRARKFARHVSPEPYDDEDEGARETFSALQSSAVAPADDPTFDPSLSQVNLNLYRNAINHAAALSTPRAINHAAVQVDRTERSNKGREAPQHSSFFNHVAKYAATDPRDEYATGRTENAMYPPRHSANARNPVSRLPRNAGSTFTEVFEVDPSYLDADAKMEDGVYGEPSDKESVVSARAMAEKHLEGILATNDHNALQRNSLEWFTIVDFFGGAKYMIENQPGGKAVILMDERWDPIKNMICCKKMELSGKEWQIKRSFRHGA